MIRKIAAYFMFIVLVSVIVYQRLPESKLPAGTSVDRIVVLKAKRQMLVYAKGVLLNTYTVSLGNSPVGKKKFEGDGKTPQGLYAINAKNPNSVCHNNLGISYPNKTDMANAQKAGLQPGGDIKIHGISNRYSFVGKFQRWYDWADGCIGLTNDEIEDLYAHVPKGVLIE